MLSTYTFIDNQGSTHVVRAFHSMALNTPDGLRRFVLRDHDGIRRVFWRIRYAFVDGRPLYPLTDTEGNPNKLVQAATSFGMGAGQANELPLSQEFDLIREAAELLRGVLARDAQHRRELDGSTLLGLAETIARRLQAAEKAIHCAEVAFDGLFSGSSTLNSHVSNIRLLVSQLKSHAYVHPNTDPFRALEELNRAAKVWFNLSSSAKTKLTRYEALIKLLKAQRELAKRRGEEMLNDGQILQKEIDKELSA